MRLANIPQHKLSLTGSTQHIFTYINTSFVEYIVSYHFRHFTGTDLDGYVDILKSCFEILLLHTTWDVAQMKSGRGRVDILIIFTAWLLEPM